MENQIFQQLMIEDANAILSDDQKEFVITHKEILVCGNMAGQYVVEMARKLKYMRDGKLYKAAGFEEFRDYTKQAIGIEERQAYNYIKVAENLSDDFLTANAGLGITKLAILASADKEDRAAAIESGTAESANVKELQEYIKKLEIERDNKTEQLSIFQKEKESAEKAKASAEADAEKMRKKLETAEKRVNTLKQAKELAEKEVADLKNLPPEIQHVDNPETVEKLKEAEEARDSAIRELESAKKQLEIAADDRMVRFKIKFDDLQSMLDEVFALLAEMDADKKARCINALKVVFQERGL